MDRTQRTAKKADIEEILDLIKPGQRIFISSGPSIPARFVNAIINSDRNNIQDLEIIQLITIGDALSVDGMPLPRFRLKTFNVGESISKEISDGKVDFIPAHLIEIPYIFSTGAVGVDVAIVQTTPPDSRGFLNLGIANDVANIAIKKASVVIAEVNRTFRLPAAKQISIWTRSTISLKAMLRF